MEQLLETAEVETGPSPETAVIWMHGLGADGHDFEPIVPQFAMNMPTRFVFPHAPVQPVTINDGIAMRAWYDVLEIDVARRVDEAGVRRSHDAIHALIKRENDRGIPTDRIALAGFSQGGAMAIFAGLRHPETLAGVIALSSYMVLGDTLATERSDANRGTPILIGHGTHDPLVPLSLGEAARDTIDALGYPTQWQTWPMQHEVCVEEIELVRTFLHDTLYGDSPNA